MALLLSAVAAAQVHGIPASVTSPRDGNVFRPVGIPASVTSLGPEGFTSFVDLRPMPPPRRNRLGRFVNVAPIPLFYGVPYYPVVYLPAEPESRVERIVEPARTPNEPQRIIVEIRDPRPLPETKPTPEAAPAVAPAARVEAAEPERVATVFIFRDGSRKELKDFAITDSELIDLSAGLIKRSPLAELDRAATLKVNAEKGVELKLPAIGD